ncbi:MAG: LPXTG cell wall anchor domain-containing protein [Oscillospiraceae bacterium]|nr:LPXTG cell wall anchor domain-containing protein [Oscillospiraceae bacterium]
MIPENYTVAYKDNQTQYLIVNTYSPTTDDSSRETQVTTATTATDDHAFGTQTTAVTDQSTDVATTTSTGSSAANTSDTAQTTTQTVTTTDVTSGGDDLPQTGQLWWPVPVLAGGGLLLFGAGLYLRKKKGSE